MKRIIILLVLLALTLGATAQFEDFTNLHPYASNPVVYSGQSRAYYAHVIKIGPTDYRMYYSDINATGATRTALATSTNGDTWAFNSWLPDYGHAAINYDSSGHGIGYNYILWVYQNGVNWNAVGGIKTYYSNDGIDFSTYAGPLNMTWMPWANTTRGNYFYGSYGVVESFYHPSATNTGSNPFDYTYTTYFDCSDGANEARCIAGGPDPTHLNAGTQSVVLAPGGIWNATKGGNDGAWDSYKSGYGDVILYKGNYLAWYDGGAIDTREALGLASSSNGLSFTKDVGNPFIRQSTAPWFNRSAGGPCVIVEDTYARLYIGGRNATSTYFVTQYRYDLPTTTTTTTSTTTSTTTTTTSSTTTTLPPTTTTTIVANTCNTFCQQRGYDRGNSGACPHDDLVNNCCCSPAKTNVPQAAVVDLKTGQVQTLAPHILSPVVPSAPYNPNGKTASDGQTITGGDGQPPQKEGFECKDGQCIKKTESLNIFASATNSISGVFSWLKKILGF